MAPTHPRGARLELESRDAEARRRPYTRPVTHPAVDPSRLLRPRRAGVDVLRAAADEGGDDAEVWERLAARGHIPASWTTSERRAFSAWCHCLLYTSDAADE